MGKRTARIAASVITIAALLACGDGDQRSSTASSTAQLAASEVSAPPSVGDMATDGLAWINFRRDQAGLQRLDRDARLDRAALAHAAYQQLNNLITHDEEAARIGFSGTNAPDRLRAAGYPLDTAARADGEVIAAIAERDGFAAAEGLLGAIYHRYLMLEPHFDQAGAGDAYRGGGYHWLNVNFVASRDSKGIGISHVAVWPVPDQQRVRTQVFSDQETPDPVPGRNAVGYPVSVHANLGSRLQVDRFALRERGGIELPTVRLDADSDPETPLSAAAIIPLVRLRAGTVHDVEFSGSVDGVPVERRWSFTTQ